jgi:hypothetical protein
MEWIIATTSLNASWSPLAFKPADIFVMNGLRGVVNEFYIIKDWFGEEANALSY